MEKALNFMHKLAQIIKKTDLLSRFLWSSLY